MDVSIPYFLAGFVLTIFLVRMGVRPFCFLFLFPSLAIGDSFKIYNAGPCNIQGAEIFYTALGTCCQSGSPSTGSPAGTFAVGTTNSTMSVVGHPSCVPLNWTVNFQGKPVFTSSATCGANAGSTIQVQGNGGVESVTGSNVVYNLTLFNFDGCTNCLENFVVGVENLGGELCTAFWAINGFVVYRTELPAFAKRTFAYPKVCKDDKITFGKTCDGGGIGNISGTLGTNGVYVPPTSAGLGSNVNFGEYSSNIVYGLATEQSLRAAVGGIQSLSTQLKNDLGTLIAKDFTISVSNLNNINITNNLSFTNSLSLSNLVNFTNAISISNNVAGFTNDFRDLTNYLGKTLIDTQNFDIKQEMLSAFASAKWSNNFHSATSSAGAVQGQMTTVFANGEPLPAEQMPDPGEFSFSIPIAGGFSFDVDSSEIPGHAVFAVVRTAVAWTIAVGLYVALLKWFEEKIFRVLNQRQTSGSMQSVLGTNLVAPTGLIYTAILITVLLVVIPTFAAAYISTYGSSAQDTSPLSGLSSYSSVGWAAANYIFPIGVFFTAAVNYVTVRFGVGVPLFTGICSVLAARIK